MIFIDDSFNAVPYTFCSSDYGNSASPARDNNRSPLRKGLYE